MREANPRQYDRTSDYGAATQSPPQNQIQPHDARPDHLEEYQMLLKERREREQRSQSSGVNQRSAQYMKAFNQNISLENGRPSCSLKQRERSAYDSRGGDPVTEYAYETRQNHEQRKPRWVAS
jgi:hypothetical protein